MQAFDELLLLKRGGRTIYNGPTGKDSQTLIDYFQGIQGVPKLTEGINPATWMLEVSTVSAEERMDLDFADTFADSEANSYVLGSLSSWVSAEISNLNMHTVWLMFDMLDCGSHGGNFTVT